MRTTTTKKGEPMAFVQLEDVTGSVEVIVFNSTYAAARELLVEDAVLVVKGRIDHKQQGETKLVALEVSRFEATPERREIRLKVDGRIAPAGLIKELGSVVQQFPGDALVYLDVITSYGEKKLELGENYRVNPAPDFFAEVRSLLGAAAVQ
jgi:DNA polymerase-3 subunit alpha